MLSSRASSAECRRHRTMPAGCDSDRHQDGAGRRCRPSGPDLCAGRPEHAARAGRLLGPSYGASGPAPRRGKPSVDSGETRSPKPRLTLSHRESTLLIGGAGVAFPSRCFRVCGCCAHPTPGCCAESVPALRRIGRRPARRRGRRPPGEPCFDLKVATSASHPEPLGDPRHAPSEPRFRTDASPGTLCHRSPSRHRVPLQARPSRRRGHVAPGAPSRPRPARVPQAPGPPRP